jgi:topoisomerase-4 subunit A
MSDQRPVTRREGEGHSLPHVEDLYQTWFLEYASYVILDRAVPDIRDGLKPVQRRILHALWELDDGRLNKAANVIGHTMRYHPHGDMAIEDALVKLAQKELLIDTQGNWGNLFTGDRAAAPRYIEGRLSKLAHEILFAEELTEWQASYDGRNKEPVCLPVKFPLLLALGVEGIAVGLSTRILPHHAGELCEAAIAYLEDRPFEILPDFPAGGLADFSQYRDGQRGGRVRVRARINVIDSKTLQIVDLPFGTTTTSLIESILAANEKGKIKIKRVEDNTSRVVDVRIHLPHGVPAEQTMEALYAFTDCEISIAPQACVIKDNKPHFCSTRELLIDSVDRTRELLRRELELEQAKLETKIRKATLEKLFIEQKLYRKIEGSESWEDTLSTLQKAFRPLLKDLNWELLESDLEALLEIRFKRLTKYDSDTAAAQLEALERQLKATKKKLSRITAHAIAYYRSLIEKYVKEPRRTTIASFGEIKAREVVIANQKLYVNRAEGFLGTGLKKDEFVTECSDLDEVFVLRRNGQAAVVKVSEKCFVGEDIFYLALLPHEGAESVLHLLFRDPDKDSLWAKRQKLGAMSREKLYELVKGGCEVLRARLTAEAKDDWLEIHLDGAHEPWFFNFASLNWSGRGVRGQKLSERSICEFRVLGELAPDIAVATLCYDPKARKLELSGKGQKLGQVRAADLLYAVTQDGEMRVFIAGASQVLSAPLMAWGLFRPEQIYTAAFAQHRPGHYGVRRWKAEDLADGSLVRVFQAEEGERMTFFSKSERSLLELQYLKQGPSSAAPPEMIPLGELVAVKGLKAAPWRLQRQAVAAWREVEEAAE